MKKNLEFIQKISEILSERISPSRTIFEVKKIFKSYFKTDNLEIIVWDNNNMLLKNFVQDWKVYSDSDKYVNCAYDTIAEKNGKVFCFNDNLYSVLLNTDEYYELISQKEAVNKIIYPLVSNGEVFGIIGLTIEESDINNDLFPVLNISSKLLSGAILNYLLNEQMERSLNFYTAMKDIAKIIESQYELSYIIPLIGEMIDRFMSAHLIYVFIKKDGKYKLVWPNACKDVQIYKLLENINDKTEYITSSDMKVGVFPIKNEENILGVIAAYSNTDKLLQNDIDYLVQLTRQSAVTIQRANVYAEVLKYATLDALTGLNNRRQFEIRLKQEISNSKRNNLPLCCMMSDVDYFKKVNDTYGHSAGDIVLKSVADIIKKEIREYDIACRYGGEEFFIILPQTNINEASLVAKRLRKVIEESKIDITEAGVEGVNSLNITVSIGVCAYNNSMTPEMFVQTADKSLYEAKTTGRNRVIVAGTP